MVVLTIVTKKNRETIHFQEPIPKVRFIKLISCSLYNSWYNLKREGSIGVSDEKNSTSVEIKAGHYTLDRLVKEMENIIEALNYKDFKVEKDRGLSRVVIKNLGMKEVRFDNDIASLLGVGQKLPPNGELYINSLTSPTTYFIHCVLVDTEKNLFNGEKSYIIARFDIKEEPWQKTRYHASSQEVLRDCSTR